jgi:WD40 repeat protein
LDIRSCVFNALNRVAAACIDNSVRVYRVDTGARVATLYGHSGPVNCASWAPNNQILASGGDDGRCVAQCSLRCNRCVCTCITLVPLLQDEVVGIAVTAAVEHVCVGALS